ncbi:30S ribosomal protein S4 [Candidatus Woesearchaeota archaeon]|jgi:small subunit ribosomal protein S4|nr:30S ribosomal protein S4 [Candidatus Woesearchaeota archaeon]
MGDPKKTRKKYSGPNHPWNKERIEEEKALKAEFGLKNKTEIYRMNSLLRNFFLQAKKLVTQTGSQAEIEKAQLLKKLQKLGFLSSEASLPNVLSLSIRDLMERRLQTMVYKKMLANSAKQARQFITHKHITVNEKIITAPSYLVSLNEEHTISFIERSAISNPEHPERASLEKKKKTDTPGAEPVKKETLKSKPKKEQAKPKK